MDKWSVSSGNAVNYTNTNTLSITGVETLVGGSGADTLSLGDGVVFNGTLNGGAGSDQLLFTNYSTARNVVLTSAGSIDGFNGTEASVTTFANMDALIGTSNTDSLTSAAINATLELDGRTATISARTRLTFTSFETLLGGAGNDTFKFGDAYTFNGTINGGVGNDTVDLSAFITQRVVTLTSVGATDGFNGTTVSVSGGFTNINNFIGSTSIGTDQLYGPNLVAAWQIGATNSITVNANSATFSSFESLRGGTEADTFTVSGTGNDVTLRGGAGTDRFVFNDGATINGSVDGQGGNGNTIDYSNYVTGVSINLSTLSMLGVDSFSATGVASITNVQNVIGGGGDDLLIGDSDDNVITGNGGSDQLFGGEGNDIYKFGNDFGANDVITENAGEEHRHR